jgi:hypothetical protein
MAGSSLGFKHTPETRKNMIGKNKGRARPIGAGSISIPIEIFDLETGITTICPSMLEKEKSLIVNPGSIRTYFCRKGTYYYKGRYLLKKQHLIHQILNFPNSQTKKTQTQYPIPNS